MTLLDRSEKRSKIEWRELEWVREWVDERMYGKYRNGIGCIGDYVARQSASYYYYYYHYYYYYWTGWTCNLSFDRWNTRPFINLQNYLVPILHYITLHLLPRIEDGVSTTK